MTDLPDQASMRDILKQHDIDPDILGSTRIMGIAQRLRAMGTREEGFKDLRFKHTHQPAKGTTEQTLAARVSQLEHELAYTRQEVEFLKNVLHMKRTLPATNTVMFWMSV